MKKYRVLIILAILFVLYRRSRVGKTATPTNSGLGAECSKHQCGGMPVGRVGVIPVCPEGCKCGKVNPMIPDAPRQCEPIG